jgi:hypothetical protein
MTFMGTKGMGETPPLFFVISEHEIPAFAEAPARRTRLWQAGLRAGGRISKQIRISKI